MLVCQGTVVKVSKEEKTYVTVEIKWDRECLREGESETSWDKLMRSKWIAEDNANYLISSSTILLLTHLSEALCNNALSTGIILHC